MVVDKRTYPMLLIRHIALPGRSRWSDGQAVARAVRTAAIGVNILLILTTAWFDLFYDLKLDRKDAWMRVLLVVLPRFIVVALPRYALLATRFDRRAFISVSLFIVQQVLQTVW